MNKKITAMANGTKQSGARANKRTNLAGTGTPAKARTFLSRNKKTQISEYTKTLTTPTRPAKGDPTKPARAGAPKTRKYTKRGKPGVNPNNIAGEALMDLRNIQRKYSLTTDDLAYCTKVLVDLIDSPLDCDQFLTRCKE